MSSTISKKDSAWKHAYEKQGDKGVYCKYCHHKSKGGITRLKEHLGQTHKGVAPCPNVPDEVRNEIGRRVYKVLKF